jgi:hypothetical protein
MTLLRTQGRKRRDLLLATVLAMLSSLLPSTSLGEVLNGFDLRDASVPIPAIQRGGPPRDGIPAIDHPRFVPAGQADLRDGDRVLGIARHGVVRAYPVRILNWHEIVNDRLGGEPVAITYCPLCGTGMAFNARVGGRELAFGVSGLLYNSDVLLYDRATQSLWSQIMSRAITGPLKGTVLTVEPLTHTTWADWRTRHPRTEVLSADTGHVRDYARDPYEGYDKVTQLMFDVEHRDARLPPKEWVLGLRLDGEVKAYPFSRLERLADARGRLADTVAGRRIEIRYDRLHRTAEVFDADGRSLPAVMAYWFAWVAFHPKTELLKEP